MQASGRGFVSCSARPQRWAWLTERRWASYQEHRGVSKLSFADRGPVTGVDLSAWDSKSSGCVLPEDLKALLQITDGLTLKWDANLHGAAAKDLRGSSTLEFPVKPSGWVIPLRLKACQHARTRCGGGA